MSNLSDEEIDALTRKQIETKFIGAFDIPEGKSVSLEITKVIPPGHEELYPGKKTEKTVLEFAGTAKKLILCNTNYKALLAILGRRPSQWVGKKFSIVESVTDSHGKKNIPCVRVLCPTGTRIPFSSLQYVVFENDFRRSQKK